MPIERFLAMADAVLPRVGEWYRWLHAHPELSGRERATADFVERELRGLGLCDIRRYACGGLTCDLCGAAPGPWRAVRAELDALPVREATGAPYASLAQGAMHACGHDFHMAAALGLAAVAAANPGELRGRLTLVFEPSEELLPGGARAMLAEGLFAGPAPDLIVAQHVLPELPAGHVGFREGPYMASGDEVTLVVEGAPGHAALPRGGGDAVLTLARALAALDQVRARAREAAAPLALAFGRLQADGANNVLPAEARAWGTLRAFDPAVRREAKEQISLIVGQISEQNGCRGRADIAEGYPPLANDPAATRRAAATAARLLGPGRVHALPLRTTCDDFAYFGPVAPSLFYRIGAGARHGLHTAGFLPDTAAFGPSVALLSALALADGE